MSKNARNKSAQDENLEWKRTISTDKNDGNVALVLGDLNYWIAGSCARKTSYHRNSLRHFNKNGKLSSA